ncbi:putative ankyrin repeat protein RF_0381 [Octopus bimaculoides]|uniref:SOCS box domain-containing protein n=1 Tax=Octopus bimaculoides TaxID=37653 RepID=A0A0L8FL00_OCTBM|nr:putative ankyrin repeat protein RF_0381 [Octopus bimaculoides]XP_014788884.1 putative ankyrin repeat protein RF_0381 [Octopus bimaculoides]XP_014788885.1 putative ankyrin repeat protein RF_0381 [Octopus bimaculoides]XP_014788886.1 putative ankyrin repeat protein RF_0381 [Octopus bimaculoides]XP_014788887.1 putative ankyrin repeat protein RF_0381 [Octopus bimaculoides]XP_052822316.1 putative ankyrin repeat protein RF_0381 [Octopus bimaculoides]|eukprot:XP_014788883.1 PREDICTED: putative ankyrin repeat protein RF_0381 [Octopus bimaculoides]
MPESAEGDWSLIEAARDGRLSNVQELLESKCGNYIHRDQSGRTPLHYAAENGNLQILCLLIEANFDINAKDNQGQTPLHIACHYRQLDIATCLIALGCDVNTCDVQHNTPLHRATRSNLDQLVSMLCECGASVNALNCCQWSPLYESIRIGNETIISCLLEYGADTNLIQRNNMSPFLTAIFYHRIASRNSYNISSILKSFIQYGSLLSHSDGVWSHLSAAVSIDQTDVAIILILNGCRIEKRGRYSRSLLVDMFDRCETRLVKLYVLAGYAVTWDEIDQCSRRVPSFSRSFMRLVQPGSDISSARRHLLDWLRKRIKTPCTLSEICRTSIRSKLNEVSGDTNINPFIERLPLPKSIKAYIGMSDWISENLS